MTNMAGQVELHPSYPQNDLLAYCKTKNIIMTGYSPLGQYNSPFFQNPTLKEVAMKEGGTVAQVRSGSLCLCRDLWTVPALGVNKLGYPARHHCHS
jgi:hypothetical protein